MNNTAFQNDIPDVPKPAGPTNSSTLTKKTFLNYLTPIIVSKIRKGEFEDHRKCIEMQLGGKDEFKIKIFSGLIWVYVDIHSKNDDDNTWDNLSYFLFRTHPISKAFKQIKRGSQKLNRMYTKMYENV